MSAQVLAAPHLTPSGKRVDCSRLKLSDVDLIVFSYLCSIFQIYYIFLRIPSTPSEDILVIMIFSNLIVATRYLINRRQSLTLDRSENSFLFHCYFDY